MLNLDIALIAAVCYRQTAVLTDNVIHEFKGTVDKHVGDCREGEKAAEIYRVMNGFQLMGQNSIDNPGKFL